MRLVLCESEEMWISSMSVSTGWPTHKKKWRVSAFRYGFDFVCGLEASQGVDRGGSVTSGVAWLAQVQKGRSWGSVALRGLSDRALLPMTGFSCMSNLAHTKRMNSTCPSSSDRARGEHGIRRSADRWVPSSIWQSVTNAEQLRTTEEGGAVRGS